MHISAQGLRFIARFEGFAPAPYRCPAGWMTIGYGHVIRKGEFFAALTIEDAFALLRRDAQSAERAVSRLLPRPLTQPQFDAVVSFTFNLGAAALERSALRRAIAHGDADRIAREWMRWVWAGGRKLPGLARRRAAELALFRQ